jgi:hypothetical protein
VQQAQVLLQVVVLVVLEHCAWQHPYIVTRLINQLH